jgi:hypothetical protein
LLELFARDAEPFLGYLTYTPFDRQLTRNLILQDYRRFFDGREYPGGRHR